MRINRAWLITIFFFISVHAACLFSQEKGTLPGSDSGNDSAAVGGKNKTVTLGVLDLFLTAPIVAGGERDEDEVAGKIRNKKDYFIQCYTNYHTQYDDYTFKVRFRITINPSGEVQDVVTLSKGTKNSSIILCMKNVIRQIRFQPLPRENGLCTVEQSFIFRVL